MTTNAGSREMETGAIGFGGSESGGSRDSKKALEKLFTPEFRNRLDTTIFFDKLPLEVIRRVVTKFIDELDGQLADKHVSLEVSPEAVTWFADHGYDPKFGARPMARIIQDKLKVALADELLFGKLADGGIAFIDIDPKTDDVIIRCESKPKDDAAEGKVADPVS
jgi:ATP-dependent Clp protease ATP-binding subunit ClpA